ENVSFLSGLESIDYLNSGWALAVVLCSFLWKNTGYMVILWLAGLAALPKEVEEAAKVDGANRWQNWHYIIRPGLSGSFFTIGMLSVLQIFKSYREVWMVAGSYPQENIYFLQHLLQNWYLKLEFDRMAALTVILSLVLLVVCLLLQKRLEPEQ
ncbi:MAG: ABC transporter permease subunit, partial [Lachnospiraceae bacterium]|nr:ABC transporter permease subunit [Lachnospiraceae bacterium]